MSHNPVHLRRTYSTALLKAGRLWRRAADGLASRHGLSEATALPLLLIGRFAEEPRQSVLAEAVGIEGPSLVRLLDHLCAVGFVTRREDPSDKRAKILGLTAAGTAVAATIERELEVLRERVFADVSLADLEASLRVFERLQAYAEAMDAAEAEVER